jgi:hypothetical protein
MRPSDPQTIKILSDAHIELLTGSRAARSRKAGVRRGLRHLPREN